VERYLNSLLALLLYKVTSIDKDMIDTMELLTFLRQIF